MESPVISVIVPFYNAGATLSQCVESIRHQLGPALEVICVDDASTDDGASKLLAKYSGDPRVRLLRQDQNQGAGAARNRGLLEAHGEYVLFVDADDTLTRGALLRLYTLARERNSEIAKGAFAFTFPGGVSRTASWSSVSRGVETTSIHESDLLQRIPGSHCNYLYRRRFLVDNDLRYPTDLRLGEDLVFIARALLRARRVTLTPQVVYRYHQSPSSLTRQKLLGREALLSAIEQRKRVARLLREHGLAQAATGYLERWEYQTTEYWTPMARHRPSSEWNRVFHAFREALTEGGLPWRTRTPLEYRYLYALLISREDEQAIGLLRSGELLRGFRSPDQRAAAAGLVDRFIANAGPKG